MLAAESLKRDWRYDGLIILKTGLLLSDQIARSRWLRTLHLLTCRSASLTLIASPLRLLKIDLLLWFLLQSVVVPALGLVESSGAIFFSSIHA